MAEALALRAAPVGVARDLVDLGKPRVTLLVIFTTAIGTWLAPTGPGPWVTAGFLIATALLVASANTLNCYVERDTDARMVRTRDRPLPAGRLSPRVALISGLVLGGVALVGLGLAANPLTMGLGAAALLTYVLVYTPMKRRTPLALHVGAIPGAIPPLMGWTASTGEIGTPGVALFALLWAWQLPHFAAIALYLKEDYDRGGLRVLPVALGDDTARSHLLTYTLLTVAVGLALVPAGVGGPFYLVATTIVGVPFVALVWRGVRAGCGGAWARRVFLYSIGYLMVVVTALLVDAR